MEGFCPTPLKHVRSERLSGELLRRGSLLLSVAEDPRGFFQRLKLGQGKQSSWLKVVVLVSASCVALDATCVDSKIAQWV